MMVLEQMISQNSVEVKSRNANIEEQNVNGLSTNNNEEIVNLERIGTGHNDMTSKDLLNGVNEWDKDNVRVNAEARLISPCNDCSEDDRYRINYVDGQRDYSLSQNLESQESTSLVHYANCLSDDLWKGVYHNLTEIIAAKEESLSKSDQAESPQNGVFSPDNAVDLDHFVQEEHHNDISKDAIVCEEVEVSSQSSNTSTTKKVLKSKKLSRKERKKKKLLKRLPSVEHSFEAMGFTTSPRVETDASDSLGCPICFEVFFNPYSCVPCNHSYCEPCLRRIAKYNTDRKRSHRCPICRVIISRCALNEEIHEKVQALMPEEYQRRGKCEANNRYMSHPLPFTPKIPTMKSITDAISERQRNHQEMREHAESYWKMVLTTAIFFICKGLVILGLVWFFSLFSEDGFMTNAWESFWDHLYRYDRLDSQRKAEISNSAFLAILGVMLLYSIYYGFMRNGLHAHNRRF